MIETETDDLLVEAIRWVCHRKRELGLVGFEESKETNHLICLQSSPGGGKSFNLDLIANLGKDQVRFQSLLGKAKEKAKQKDFDETIYDKASCFSNTIGLTITHINGRGFIHGDHTNVIKSTLGWRMLYS